MHAHQTLHAPSTAFAAPKPPSARLPRTRRRYSHPAPANNSASFPAPPAFPTQPPIQHFSSRRRGDSVVVHAKGPKVSWVCRECGFEHSQRWGQCRECGASNSLERHEIAPATASEFRSAGMVASKATGTQGARSKGWTSSTAAGNGADVSIAGALTGGLSGPQSLRSLSQTRHLRPSRFALRGRTGEEVNRVLGGGVVPGSLVLVGGDPGVGKSTLLLQIAGMIAAPGLDYDAMLDDSRDQQQQQQQQQHANTSGALESDNGVPVSSSARGRGKGKAKSGRGQLAGGGPQEATESKEARGADDEDYDDDAGSGSESEEEAVQGFGGTAMDSRRVLYVSGEELYWQVQDRAERMGLGHLDSLFVVGEYRMEVVAQHVHSLRPVALVVDSIQTMTLSALENPMGSPTQLTECSICLKNLAHATGTTVFTIGHMTKNNEIAGPRAMMHMVDVVLRLQEDMSQAFRMLRAEKNRYGSTGEMGVFSMDYGGMRAVDDLSSQLLASRSSSSVASALTITVEGSTPVAMEVQALVTPQHPQAQAPPLRQPSGVNPQRLGPIIVSVLHNYALRMHNKNVVVSITGGLQMRESAVDLAIAVAIVSGNFGTPVPRDMVVLGEIDLTGGLRAVKNTETRLAEAAKLGLKQAVIPNPSPADLNRLRKRFEGLELLPCSTLRDALCTVCGDEVCRELEPLRRFQGNKKGKARPQKAVQAARSSPEIEEVDDGELPSEDEPTWEEDEEV